MKTKNYIRLLLVFFYPLITHAQWSMVRFDERNTFSKVATVNANTVFLIGIDPVSTKQFILRTNTAGATWDSISFNSPTDHYELHELFFLDANTGFVGGIKNNKQVLLKTVNNGNTWMDITPDPTSLYRIQSIYFVDALNGYALNGHTLFATTNGGVSWIIKPEPPYSFDDLYFTDVNNGYACGGYLTWTSFGPIIAKTSDGGQTWNPLLSNVADPNLFISSFSKEDFINGTTGFTFLQGSGRIFRTLNGGNTWDTLFAPSAITDFDFVSADTGHIVSENGEIFATIDGGQTWTLEYTTSWGLYGPSVTLNALSFVGETGFVGGSNGLIKRHSIAVTGIKEEKSKGMFHVYPNPLIHSQDIIINVPEMIEDGSIQIINAVGQMVWEKKINYLENNSTLTLSDIHLPEGIYYLVLETKEKRSAEKLIIME